jgi:acyl-CoA thioesterase FadM
MSGLVSRWVVLQRHRVGAEDLDAGGGVLGDVVARWVSEACAAYLERCSVMREVRERSGLVLRSRISELPAGVRLGRPTTVVVSAGATGVRPGSFTIAFRLRPTDGTGDVAVRAACVMSLENPATGEVCDLGNEVRDELIALEHGAEHFN